MPAHPIPKTRPRPRAAQPGGRLAGPAGFALPLALLTALLLLLGALAAQTASLQLRSRSGNDQRLAAAEDALHSAAQQLLGRINRRHHCLLLLPLEQWPALEGSCGSAAELAALRSDAVLGHAWQLLSWQPGGSGTVELLLETLPSAAAEVRRARFSVALRGEPPQVVDLRLRGLQGVVP
ncbi:MAG: hypothetical protein VKI83_12160 [Synechococcaceae cyanobacterium]|nr:hypothetical protein [Synechococcaceae cyanobacterium]